MKNIILLLLFTLSYNGFEVLIASEIETYGEKNLTASNLETTIQGVWKLKSRKWYSDSKQFADCEIYKIITAERWATIFYWKEGNKFAGAGGGTYVFDGQLYTEKLEYFSWDQEAHGTIQSFRMEIKDGDLYQSGVLNAGKYESRDLFEVYEKVDVSIADGSTFHPLVGIWELKQASYGDKILSAVDIKNKYGRAIKFMTPRYYYGVFFNPENGNFDGVTFGKYTANASNFTETVLAFSWDSGVSSVPQIFEWDMENSGVFHQHGYLKSEQNEDYLIDEHYVRME